MCTAITYKTKDFYFGRTLDLEYHYSESVTVTPRHYPLEFVNGVRMESHYAIIGVATVEKGYPLYYDAVNEKGLAAAGLAFLMLNLFTPPCFAAISAMSAELSSKKWFWAAIGLQFGTGYSVAFVVCQVGTLISAGSLAAGFVPGLVAVLAYAAILTVLAIRAKRKA